MLALQDPPPTPAPPGWHDDQILRAVQRMRAPWQLALAGCRGLHAVVLGVGPEDCDPRICPLPHRLLLQARAGHPLELEGAWRGDLMRWPLAPGQIDAVLLDLHPDWLPALPDLVAALTQALGPDGRLAVRIAGADALQAWCHVGMPLLHMQGLVLQTAAWGDTRWLTRLPARWRYHWHAGWQQWLGLAEWSVQLWQKETDCLVRTRRRRSQREARWTGIWLPQSRAPVHMTRKPDET